MPVASRKDDQGEQNNKGAFVGRIQKRIVISDYMDSYNKKRKIRKRTTACPRAPHDEKSRGKNNIRSLAAPFERFYDKEIDSGPSLVTSVLSCKYKRVFIFVIIRVLSAALKSPSLDFEGCMMKRLNRKLKETNLMSKFDWDSAESPVARESHTHVVYNHTPTLACCYILGT